MCDYYCNNIVYPSITVILTCTNDRLDGLSLVCQYTKAAYQKNYRPGKAPAMHQHARPTAVPMARRSK